MRDRRRHARCVPDRPVNAGYLRSLADSPMHRLTCGRAARPAAHTDLLSHSYPWWDARFGQIFGLAGGQRRPRSGHDSDALCLAGSFVMRMTVKVTRNLGQASTTVEGPHGP